MNLWRKKSTTSTETYTFMLPEWELFGAPIPVSAYLYRGNEGWWLSMGTQLSQIVGDNLPACEAQACAEERILELLSETADYLEDSINWRQAKAWKADREKDAKFWQKQQAAARAEIEAAGPTRPEEVRAAYDSRWSAAEPDDSV